MKTAIGVGVIVGLGVAVVLFFEHIDYAFNYGFARTYHDDAPTITFRAFKTFYALNPSKWDLWSDYVCYRGNTVCFKSFIDYLQYQKFHADEDKRITETNKIRNETDFIKSLQKDVDDYRKENLREMKRILEK